MLRMSGSEFCIGTGNENKTNAWINSRLLDKLIKIKDSKKCRTITKQEVCF